MNVPRFSGFDSMQRRLQPKQKAFSMVCCVGSVEEVNQSSALWTVSTYGASPGAERRIDFIVEPISSKLFTLSRGPKHSGQNGFY